MIKQINETDFNSVVGTDELSVVIFSAAWCSSCQTIKPQIEDMQKNLPDVTFYDMDVDKNTDFALSHNVRSLPTFGFYKNGNKLFIDKGMNTITIRKKIDELK